MKLCSPNKRHRTAAIILQVFALLLLSAWMSAAYARNMEVTISATPDPAVAGEELIYTVAYRNAGSACPQARLHFTLPQHVGSASGTTQSWFLRTLPGGRHGSRTVRVKVDSPLPPNTELLTTASVTSTGAVTCQTTVNDDTKVRPALLVTKTSSVGTVDAGGQLVYTLHFDNAGKGDATNVILKDTLPGNVSFVSATGSHSESGNIVTWNLGTVVAGAKGSVTLTVGVDGRIANGTILTNSGTIDSTETDPSPFSLEVNVHSEPVLTLTKTAFKDPVSPGDHLVYSLHYENQGTAEATNLVLKDVLPAGVTFLLASNNGTESGGTVTWNLGTLPPKQSGDLTLTVLVDGAVVNGHTLENTATLDSDETELITALKDVVVLAEPAFKITKTASKDPVHPGDELTFTINYRNIGSGQGTGIIIEDDLPADVTFKSASGGGSESGGKVTWNLAALSAGVHGSVTVTVTVNSPLGEGTILLNTVSMVSTETEPHLVTDVIELTVHSEPVLKLKKTHSKNPVNAGDELVYTITYENKGTGAATSITLEDDLPAEVTFKSATGPYSESGGKVSWNLPALTAGGKGSVTVTVTVNSPLANDTVLHNVTTIDSAETQPLSDFDDVTVSSTAALQLTKTASKDIVNPGDELIYTIAYANVGSDQATQVVLEDIVPAGVTFKSASSPGTLTGGFVKWHLGTLAAGAKGSVTLTVTVGGLSDGDTITNVANITSVETPHPVTDEVQTPVLSEPVLEISKTPSKFLVIPGETVIYTIEFKNVGTGDATGVIISDTLPGDVTYLWAHGHEAPTISGGVVTWPSITIHAGASPQTVTVAAFVNSPLADGTGLLNTVSIHSNQTAPLSSEVGITVLSKPVLELTKSPSRAQVSPGDSLTYTIEYKNVGTDVASGIKLEDHLPGDVTFVSASGGGTESNGIVTWDLGAMQAGGAPASVFVIVTVNSPLADGKILHNPASIDSNETSPVSAIVDVTVLSHPRLELSKTAARDHVSPGDTLLYTIEYKNTGTDQATGVSLEDHIPGDVTFVSATGGGVESGGIVRWDLGILPAGAPAGSVIVTVKINDPLPNGTVIHNPASIKSKQTPSITSQAPVSVISAPVLKLTKSASKNPVLPGDTLVYTLDYSNEGTDQATGVRLTDQLPADVTFVSASGGGTESGGIVSWDLGLMSAWGAPGSVSVTVTVNSPLADGTKLHNVASIKSKQTSSITSIELVSVKSTPVLELNKTASQDHVSPGDSLTYTLEYKNTGTDQATGVTLEDHLPAEVTFVSASGVATESNGIVSWDIGTLPAGSPAGSVTATVRINDSLPNGIVIHNPASIDSAETPPLTSEAQVSIISAPVLKLTNSAPNQPFLPGDTLVYTLDYKNEGTDQATGVTLEDHLPAGVTFVSASGGGTESGGIVKWNLSPIPVGQTGSETITVTINASVPDSTVLHNAATINSVETQPVSAQSSVTVFTGLVLGGVPVPIPTLGLLMTLMLSLLLFAAGGYSIARRKARQAPE